MTTTPTATAELGAEDFGADTHAAKYQGQLDAHPRAFRRLFVLLNDPANEQRLVDAEMQGLPALAGVVRFIEADPAIVRVLTTGSDGVRFRQTIGIAIKLKMAKLGWTTTGTKGSVRGADHFAKAEHYVAAADPAPGYATRALAALDAVQRSGDDREREQTGRSLIDALTATRADEGRPF